MVFSGYATQFLNAVQLNRIDFLRTGIPARFAARRGFFLFVKIWLFKTLMTGGL